LDIPYAEKVIKAKVTFNAEEYSAACNAHN